MAKYYAQESSTHAEAGAAAAAQPVAAAEKKESLDDIPHKKMPGGRAKRAAEATAKLQEAKEGFRQNPEYGHDHLAAEREAALSARFHQFWRETTPAAPYWPSTPLNPQALHKTTG